MSSLAPSRRERLSGIAYMVAGIASFAAMDAIGKWMVRDHSVFQILAIRSSLIAMSLTAAVPFVGGRDVMRSPQVLGHVLRALAGVAAFLFFFTSVRYLPLADAVAIAFGGPFIVTALSVPLLGEQVDLRRWIAILIGFIGMLLIVQPTGTGFRPAALLVIAASISYALMMIITRWLALEHQEKAFTFVLYNFIVQALCGWACVSVWVLFSDGGWRPMDARSWGLIIVMGALALAGHFGIALAFQRAPVSVVAPFEYTALIWATVLGFVVFGDFPSAAVWSGVGVIVAAGLYTIHRER